MSYPPPNPGLPPPWPNPAPGARPATPLPAVPLDFPPRGQRTFERRPGVITGIGVASIVVALGTMLGCLFIGGWALAMFAMSQRPPMVFTTPPAPVMGAPVIQQGPEEDAINGLPKAQRQLVIRALGQAKLLTPYNRVRQVDALLANSGRTIFPTATPGASVAIIRQNITDSGVLPSASATKIGPHYYIVGTGRIEVYDDHAVFRPTGAGEPTSVSADAQELEQSRRQAAMVRPMLTPAPNAAAMKKLATPSLTVMLETLVSGAVAVFLLVAGIMVLRNSLAGAKLHWVYIWIKIPLAIFAAVAAWWLWTTYIAAMSNSRGPTGFASSAAIMGLIGNAFAVLYPIVLAILLKSRPVTQYYTTAREEALARPY